MNPPRRKCSERLTFALTPAEKAQVLARVRMDGAETVSIWLRNTVLSAARGSASFDEQREALIGEVAAIGERIAKNLMIFQERDAEQRRKEAADVSRAAKESKAAVENGIKTISHFLNEVLNSQGGSK